jgi:hypothetical protein
VAAVRPTAGVEFPGLVMFTARGACLTVGIPALLISCSVGLSMIIGGYVRADDVPALNVEPTCHGIAQQAAAPSGKGGPDLAYSQCVQSEQAMRARLIGEWSTFNQAEKTNCVEEETTATLPSYTDLVTCLEMARDARKLNAPSTR